MRKNKKIIFFIQLVLVCGLAFFVYNYFRVFSGEIKQTLLGANVLKLCASVLMFLLFYVILSINWLKSLKITDPDNSGTIASLSFFASQPFKNMPTSAFTFSSRAYFSKRLGTSLKSSTKAQVYENISIVSSGLIVSVLVSSFIFFEVYITMLIVLVLFFVYCLVLRKKTMRLSFKKKLFVIDFIALLSLLPISIFAWLVAGLSFSLASSALGLDISTLRLLASNSLAFVAGILVIFAPGGIGFREVVYLNFLVPATLVATWRLLTFMIDIVVGVCAFLAIKLIHQKGQ